MKKSKFTEQQIGLALRQAEGGTNVAEVCPARWGISEATFLSLEAVLWRLDVVREEPLSA